MAQNLLLHQLLAHAPQAAGEVDDLGNVLDQVKVNGGKHNHKSQQDGKDLWQRLQGKVLELVHVLQVSFAMLSFCTAWKEALPDEP